MSASESVTGSHSSTSCTSLHVFRPALRESARDLVRDRGVRGRARPVRAFREDFERLADPRGRHELVDVGTEPREKGPPRAENDESGHENREHRDGGRDDGDASNLDVLRLAFSC